jgi:hypothetical protein
MSRSISALVGFLIGVIAAAGILVHEARAKDRQEAFGLLARDVHVASVISKAAPGLRAASSKSVASDLTILALRYDSVTPSEQHLLRLVLDRSSSGLLSLSPENLAFLQSHVGP